MPTLTDSDRGCRVLVEYDSTASVDERLRVTCEDCGSQWEGFEVYTLLQQYAEHVLEVDDHHDSARRALDQPEPCVPIFGEGVRATWRAVYAAQCAKYRRIA